MKQEQKVIEYFIQNKNEPKHFEKVANDLDILVPNVRRILGQGTLKGVFNRVNVGVYEFAHYETETEETKIIKSLGEYSDKYYKEYDLWTNNIK